MLNWNIEGIANYRDLLEDNGEGGKRLDAVTYALALAGMAIGLGQITERNAREWLVRLRWLEMRSGFFLSEDGVGLAFSYAMLVRRIGLRLNVNDESRAVWLKRASQTAIRDLEYTVDGHIRGWAEGGEGTPAASAAPAKEVA